MILTLSIQMKHIAQSAQEGVCPLQLGPKEVSLMVFQVPGLFHANLMTHAKTSIVVPSYDPPPCCKESTFDLLMRLDDWGCPGISEAEFKNLLARC